MKTMFVIHATDADEQLDCQYLLCLSMLNFDHQVTLLFVDDAYTRIMEKAEQAKKWQALKLYGIDSFYQFLPKSESQENNLIKTIDMDEYEALKANMDFIS